VALTPKWLLIARNEYRIRLSRIRSIRRYFPFLAIGFLIVYVALIAPGLAGLFFDDFLAFFLSQAAIAMVQIILFVVFFYFLIIPITNTLKETQIGEIEIFLAAPIRPSDVLLGEFAGEMPFYAIIVTIITGFFTAVLLPLGLDWLQVAIIIAIFAVTFFSALWIGTVIAAVLRTRLGKTARGRDIGRALSFLIALPMVAVMYALMGGGLLETLADPAASGLIRGIFGLLPSSWGAEIIVGFAAHPANIGVIGLEVLTRFGGLLVFFFAAFWVGAKVADRAYTLESFAFTSSKAKPDGIFYNSIRVLGGGKSFGSLLTAVFKDYGRRLENLSKVFYMVGLLALVNVFLVKPEDTEGSLVMAQLILPLLAAFVTGEVTLRGKETLFIFRKTPSGVWRLIKARLVQGWLVVVPIAAVATAISTILSALTSPIYLLINVGLVGLTVAANVAFVLGLFLLNPAFSEKSSSYIVNIMLTMYIQIGLFMGPLIILERLFGFGIYQTSFFATVPLGWFFGLLFLYLGKKKLDRIE
jgi:hypothetical protein